ncbi:hypothetical protein [Pyrobaculum aerophilum]|uniref:hypothetical protein n=1 Tax=Pyrobaculum aerophilum TaxID=13773 RepID=UPI0035ABF453
MERIRALGRVYWYYKAEARPRRKMGHVNIAGSSVGEVVERAREALRLIYGRDFPRLVMRELSPAQPRPVLYLTSGGTPR